MKPVLACLGLPDPRVWQAGAATTLADFGSPLQADTGTCWETEIMAPSRRDEDRLAGKD